VIAGDLVGWLAEQLRGVAIGDRERGAGAAAAADLVGCLSSRVEWWSVVASGFVGCLRSHVEWRSAIVSEARERPLLPTLVGRPNSCVERRSAGDLEWLGGRSSGALGR
jgi:hypothetical protein